MKRRDMSAESFFVSKGLATQEQMDEAIKKAEGSEEKEFFDFLIEKRIVTIQDVLKTMSEFFEVGSINLDDFDAINVSLINENVARKNTIFPLRLDDNNDLYIATNKPRDFAFIDGISFTTGKHIVPVFASKSNILKAIELNYGKKYVQEAMDEYKRSRGDTDDEDEEGGDDGTEVNNSPVVRLVKSIIEQAIIKGASDIHIEPFETCVKVRYRIDGVLHKEIEIEKITQSAVLTRIKILAGMDIAEKRVPQDGRIETTVMNREIDLRVSSLPVVNGEKIVMRILDRSKFQVSRKMLGFTKVNSDLFDKIIMSPNGIILVTGPTGSGKTTTLYATLKELNKPTNNIITVEDPVEYMLEGINQVQVNNKAGMTFASGLRAILRQDPDIIMIGEIRDAETAQIAVRAAVTGHVVLSTMHTNDTASTVSRLLDMGIEPYLVSSTVVGVIAQRLVRRICPFCKEEITVDESQSKLLNVPAGTKVWHGKGCKECNNTGYKGRVGVHEIMLFTKNVRALIDLGKPIDEIKEYAVKEEGMRTLWDNCLEQVLAGTTTIEELLKTAYSLD